MNSIRLLNRRMGYVVAAFALLVATFVPALVSADQVTNRSIALSSSSAGASGVTYTVNFTAVKAAGAFVVDFCSDSPVIGATCTAPDSGFTAASASSSTSGFTGVTGSTTKVVVDGTIGAGATVSVDLANIHNPTNAGPLYARIVTFANDTDATAYTSTVPGSNALDQGGVAMYITPTIGVSGAVQETMTFCVAKVTITANCGNAALAGSLPTLQLGETSGGAVALSPTALSTGVLNTQITTNAASGAIISLKSATSCGGLKRVGATTCDIAPAGATGTFALGTAKFGVKTATATATSGGTDAIGTLQPHSSTYDDTNYRLNYVAGDASGITSPFGDPFLDTNSLPVNNMNMALTFAASINNNTPAGLYSTDLSMIATGKF